MKIILILGDQLNMGMSSLHDIKHEDIIIMCELIEETNYVKHHKKKLVYCLSAMRHFCETLRNNGHTVDYHTFDPNSHITSFSSLITHATKKYSCSKVVVAMPSEYRLYNDLQTLQKKLAQEHSPIHLKITPDNRFMSTLATFETWASGKKKLVMEYFYRQMRKEYGILMDNKITFGGKWNYDKSNRKKLDHELFGNDPLEFPIDAITKDVIACIETHFGNNFGDIQPFNWAVTRAGALTALEDFCERRLPLFGDYQDAMTKDSAYLYHSVISHYLNNGLLFASEVCERAEQAYHSNQAPLNAVEGFIRQILGWREYVRGIYWLYMPGYATLNTFDATAPLPAIYWGKETDMQCMSHTIRFTQQYAYSHHIQRLMVTGNFALLAGLNVQHVHEWYLAVYADAYEWVEMPNTLGMALFADGGIMATKPYAASGKYINKMSDYCKGCKYDVKKRHGDNACPFNFMYWAFLERNKTTLQNNHRMGFAYKHVNNMPDDEKVIILKQASEFIESL